jgi:dUTP pyrophosphatase
LLLVPVAQARLKIVNDFAPSERGGGGFGSTGIQ